MSITLLHGDHHVQSREALFQLVESYTQKDLSIERIEVTTHTTPAVLEDKLGSQDMFAPEKVMVIEGLLALPRSAKKTALIDLLHTFSPSNTLILWEEKKATAAQLKALNPDKQQTFNLSSTTFEWLDNLQSPVPKKLTLLQKAVVSDTADLCFMMLARQLRLLLKVKVGATLKDHPFVVKKVTSQAKYFTLGKLTALHEKLLFIDLRQKTGQARLTLQEELEQLMIQM